jgi:hypothetical protein
VLSNAWAGRLYSEHGMTGAALFAGGPDFSFLVSDGSALVYLKDSEALWSGSLGSDSVLDVQYDPEQEVFMVLGSEGVYAFEPDGGKLREVYRGSGLTCLGLTVGSQVLLGTDNGYLVVDAATGKQVGRRQTKLPWTELIVIRQIKDRLWFGSTKGAFMLRDDGKYNYYASKRWLPDDMVVDIASGPENSVLVLTAGGMARINFEEMTLQDKAMFFQEQVRERHMRHGFNYILSGLEDGDLSTGFLRDSPNDGLWTSMYLAGEVFRYVVTESGDALQNIRESLDALERLFTITQVPGFPARSFMRHWHKDGHPYWLRSADPEWDWRATTSSDEVIGHVFVYGVIAELVDDEEIRSRAITLLDTLMSHIVRHDLYLVDHNGQRTRWGRWNPEYVNGFPTMVGDRKLNSSNIIGMLQTAYHFTRKNTYRQKAFDLMRNHGYLENLMRPMEEIGRVPPGTGDHAEMLSSKWNHSDDEMYYLGYWGLYRYAFNDTLQAQYKKAIVDHWEAERPEKEGLWNICTAITGVTQFDLEEAIWYLQEHPMDFIEWTVQNSHRKDIKFVEPNFRSQFTAEVLPPDELRTAKHSRNRFELDHDGAGRQEQSAGYIWSLPYWLGRYLGVISGPVH